MRNMTSHPKADNAKLDEMKTMDATTASDYFGSMAESYDSLIRRAVPRYDEMLSRLLDYLPSTSSSVLELGCGTGNFSLSLAERFPDATLTFVDAAPEMLEITRARLTARHAAVTVERARFIEARFEELRFNPASFDLVASSISLHHVLEKASVYRNLHIWLQPGGSFRFADQLRGATSSVHELNWKRWLEFCRLDGHCSEEEVASLLDHAAAHDHYTTLAEHFRLLSQAGFTDLDCVWRNLIWGIIIAHR